MSELTLSDIETDEWQQLIREAEADIEAGRIFRITSQEEIEKALDWLDD